LFVAVESIAIYLEQTVKRGQGNTGKAAL